MSPLDACEPVPVAATAAVWAGRITEAYRKTVEAILHVGDLLIAAKSALPHGEFEAMIKRDLPFRPRHARRLMNIAGDDRIRTHVSDLPVSVGALYEVTRLTDAEFEKALAEKQITPAATRRDVEKFTKNERLEPPDEFPEFDIIEPDFRCPCCGYGWKGTPKPGGSRPAHTKAFREACSALQRAWQAAPDDARQAFVESIADAIPSSRSADSCAGGLTESNCSVA